MEKNKLVILNLFSHLYKQTLLYYHIEKLYIKFFRYIFIKLILREKLIEFIFYKMSKKHIINVSNEKEQFYHLGFRLHLPVK